ncbi:carbohydrate ABC transporter permease [Streptomyces shenzhenensis]|uniref:carbohydrate ABC transporter permease n=1 Tax=Streptomyces shenzhenensis TaxID=943815 RepID=UPI0015F01BEF|nr:sugar ABC transporter permease [Streptomyces shenzhenensis]
MTLLSSTRKTPRPPTSPPPAPARTEARSGERRQRRAGWVLFSPYLAHVLLFTAVPMGVAVALSFTDYGFLGSAHWVGLANYTELFGDERFQKATVNTILYSIVAVPVTMAAALGVSLALNQRVRFQSTYRAAFYLPQVTATVAVALVWKWIYDPNVGIANAALAFFGVGRIDWLSDPDWALPAVMLLGLWQGLGAKMIIYLAALQQVPRELFEAARMDGAGRWQTFRHVTWPMLRPATFFVLITSVVSAFQVFDQVYVMTPTGGPLQSTNVLTFDIYLNAFDGMRFGYASAESVMLFLMIGVVTLFSLRMRKAHDA